VRRRKRKQSVSLGAWEEGGERYIVSLPSRQQPRFVCELQLNQSRGQAEPKRTGIVKIRTPLGGEWFYFGNVKNEFDSGDEIRKVGPLRDFGFGVEYRNGVARGICAGVREERGGVSACEKEGEREVNLTLYVWVASTIHLQKQKQLDEHSPRN